MRLNSLPCELLAVIFEYSNVWRERFTRDVLPELNHGWRWIGVADAEYCTRCYYFGNAACGACEEVDLVSYREFVKQCSDILKDHNVNYYHPWFVFEYLYPEVSSLMDEDAMYLKHEQLLDQVKYCVPLIE